jgi:plasmid stabilization system protein ParE
MNIVKWTTSAEDAYLEILEMLRNNWNDDVAYNFYVATERLIDGLRSFKSLCPQSPKLHNFRRCVVNKHTSFTYRATDNEVEIIAFYFNKMGH